MRKNLPFIVLAVLGVMAFMKWRQAQPAAASRLLPEGGYSVVPTFKAEWAGRELQRQTGTVLPSGAARELIR